MSVAAAAEARGAAAGGRGRGRGRGVRRARASFVDESLFGSPAGARPAPPGFAPPWAAAAAADPGGGGGPGPRPRSKCRLRSHTPSFCDESLFGAKPEGPAWAAPWMRKEDVAKLHPLLWSPPPAPRNQPGLSPRSRETPLRAVHPRAPASPATAGFEVGRKGNSCVWKRPESDSCSDGRGAPGRGRSQSLSRLNTPSDGFCLASDHPKTERCKNQSPPTAPATPRGPLMRGRSKSVSGPPLARSSMAVGGCKARPPWK
ncbi:RBPJ-interacting and tubulin-associated protein 1 [Gymnogyps californianus]|uniref:RBPJ-interacting and tubulin-associated protein 1 n=1 Tax=Gymnogyps californianus TaxID=33616 RepID=UPI0021C8C41B|nr:RBPJ-interacting and tubulin-associated protein 1 [Gymnogyps californianus]